ncbi:MAG TPA: hypothetical protein VL049_18810 [Candidatus Dormibacteraeota bacterium]|nr:hypothetical protein [Candidatus Dormibacteraeota bacterium]
MFALLGLAACGGGSGGGSSSRTATPHTTPSITSTPNGTPPPTPTPGSGGPSILPDICKIGRVVFRSESGESCCIAADPALLPPKPQPGQPSLVLTNLPIGPATVTIDGYVEDFAPLPPDVTATCETLNTSGVRPCDPVLDASAAYGSDPKAITIFGGVRVNLGDVEVVALPFLLDFTPPQNSEVPLPVNLGFTVVDGQTGIARPSVALDITLNVPQGDPPVFRPLTKRVPVALDPCLDGSGRPCSPQGDLKLAGFKATGMAEYLSYLPPGPVEARITAENLADPPRNLDFSYQFMVLPQPTDTPTATTTPTPSHTPPPSFTPTRSYTATVPPTATASPSATVTATQTLTPTTTVTALSTATRTVTAIPPTPTPTESPMPTPTTLCETAPRTGCRTAGESQLQIKVAAAGDKLIWRWIDGTVPLVEFGAPTGTTFYALCIYDSIERVPVLAFAAQIEPGGQCGSSPCWSTIGTGQARGYVFIDSAGVQYGMRKVLLKGGRPGRDSLFAAGGGEVLALPLPVSVDNYFAQQNDVIVQMLTDGDGCWQSTFRPGDVVTNLPELYQAAR